LLGKILPDACDRSGHSLAFLLYIDPIIEKVRPGFFITNAALEAEFLEKHRKFDLTVYSDHAIIINDKFNFNVKEVPNGNELASDMDFQSDDLSLEIAPDSGCYIMTTSGSTGEPKAILGTHKGLSHFIDWEVNEFGFNEQIRTSMLSHVTFDVSLRDTFVPLITGGTLCIPEEDTRQNPKKLFRWLNDKKITLTHIVPTLFRMLIREVSEPGGGSNPLPNLKYLLIAGEALYGSDIINWRKVNGTHAELVNIYGPTETTLAKFFYRIKDKNFHANEVIPIGRPIPDTEVFIIKDNKHCEVGETGEIFIKTPFCSKGYYNDSELTKKSFVQNPLVNDREDIVYKTGDLGKLMSDKNISFVGRRDHQIKLYGNRVEINEIEVILREHPNVLQAVVAAKKDTFGNNRLVGYIVPAKGKYPTVESLRRYLKNKLPDYMVPSVFVTLHEIPLTHNQKINRKALPETDASRPIMEQEFVAPTSSIEQGLSAIWGKVLGVDRIGIHDNFFDLGGTSILSMHVIAMIQENIGSEIPVMKLFQYPTISSFAKYLTHKQTAKLSFKNILHRAQRRKAAFLHHKRLRVNQ